MRFRPEQHLRRQSDFRVVREHGRRLVCGAFTLWCRPRDAADPVEPASGSIRTAVGLAPGPATRRVGVVASAAAVGNAVQRNRAKRRLRAIFRSHQELVPPGFDLILSARSALNRTDYAELERRFVDACQQLSRTR